MQAFALSFFVDYSISILLILFTYAIPLLSSIRAVHNRDREAYEQWLTYFLLIFLLTPLFDLIRVHRLFRLSLVLWLSLPKFQGALFVYHEIFSMLMEKYSVEEKIDGKIDHVRKSTKEAMLNIAKDIGWSALCQVGELVTLVKGSPLNGDEGTSISQKTNEKPSNSLLQSRTPSHSVMESLSSFSSTGSLEGLNRAEREIYISDFLDMLKQGLYVFASYEDKSNTSTNGEGTKRFRLRVLFYECDDDGKNSNDSSDVDVSPYFVLHPVEQDGNLESMEIISTADLKEFRASGTNGIQFISNVSSRDTNAIASENSKVNEEESLESSPSLEASLISSASLSSLGRNSSTQSFASSTEEESAVTEIVLSDTQDRETLLQGLKTCSSYLCGGKDIGNDMSDGDQCSADGSSSVVENDGCRKDRSNAVLQSLTEESSRELEGNNTKSFDTMQENSEIDSASLGDEHDKDTGEALSVSSSPSSAGSSIEWA